jgi:hypothetical protein
LNVKLAKVMTSGYQQLASYLEKNERIADNPTQPSPHYDE